MSSDDRSPPKPLNAEESAHVKRWQRLMYGYFGLAMLVILGMFIAAQEYGDSPKARMLVLIGIGVLVVAATIVQFSGRCPRCRAYLGRQARLVLPERCRACGVEFPKP